MVERLIKKGRNIFFSQQSSIISAASIIMLMIVASRVLGLIRQRVLAHYFIPGDLAVFFAGFRLPDLIFEVLVFGTFSSAFIPVFTKALQKGKKLAWDTAANITNIGLVAFLFLTLIMVFFAGPLYKLFVPGFSPEHQKQVVELARILFVAQGFFVVSYVLTGVLESSRRFLIPALAPLFYNLGIIFGTIVLTPKFGLMAPAWGVVIGALSHFLIQLPLAIKLGFRFKFGIHLTEEVRKIGKLALPRIVEVSFLQVAKTVELSLATLISKASYTYFTFGNSLQLLPVGLFGTSIAKAALPTLARQADNKIEFSRTLYTALNQMVFLVLPIATILVVLRIPIVRLVYGTDIFSWEATVQTGMVLSAFAFGVIFQCAASLLARAFYALHDTKTPVIVSVISLLFNILINFILIKYLHFPVWGLAAAFTIGSTIQTITLFILINRRIQLNAGVSRFGSMLKSLTGTLVSGFSMFFLLKFFDLSVWVKRLSFLKKIDIVGGIPFEKFVLDTRYTVNLLALTIFVTAIGLAIYILVLFLLRSAEIKYFFNLLSSFLAKRKLKPIPQKEEELIAPSTGDTNV